MESNWLLQDHLQFPDQLIIGLLPICSLSSLLLHRRNVLTDSGIRVWAFGVGVALPPTPSRSDCSVPSIYKRKSAVLPSRCGGPGAHPNLCLDYCVPRAGLFSPGPQHCL